MKYVFVVMTNPRPGREAEYNDWYTNTHIPDVLKVPGIVAAQRFALAAKQRRDPPYPYKYLATYEIEIDDVSKTIQGLINGRASGAIPISDAMDPNTAAWIYEPITGRVVASGL